MSPQFDQNTAAINARRRRNYNTEHGPEFFESKSQDLKQRLDAYRQDPKHEKLRAQRESLPVMSRADEVLSNIAEHEVTVCMAATGSGKTTQIPQIILDDAIDRDEGAKCNIICTQPRRIAAISVAQRVANERGENVGPHSSIGYQVRFESALPDEHGSITFCTTGVFLKRLQSHFLREQAGRDLDNVTHIVVDEVHERDVDTDLLMVVLKRLMADRKARGIPPVKVILMSATIDPKLFQEYFKDQEGVQAPVFEVPGRSFPVEKHFLEDVVGDLAKNRTASWVWSDTATAKFIKRELPDVNLPVRLDLNDRELRSVSRSLDDSTTDHMVDDLEIPFALVGLTIGHVLRISDDGHVLVFLPGWEEIQAVNKILTNPDKYPLGVDFLDKEKFEIHVLHSSIPVAEQQRVFEPPPPGVRRVILSTNIAETSVTIPDVVYVVDTAKTKENRYDPSMHMTSLVSAWVGSSNLNQRAGRAGRHRPGSYYGILSRSRAALLSPHQTVEMKRADLSNVVMHIKALHFPNMAVQQVLAETIEPPEPERVEVAMKHLTQVGALDQEENLTPLGRILLQLPVDVQLGVMVLYGAFFRCLSRAVSLAAILSNRDPFLSPPLLKREATAVKASWVPEGSKSDVLATLAAYEEWAKMQNKGHFISANQFCSENFLSKPTLLLIHRIRGQLLHSLYQAGVMDVAAGGSVAGAYEDREDKQHVPSEFNENASSLPLLAGLIALATQPKFAVRTTSKLLRTNVDKHVLLHPSSTNASPLREADNKGITDSDREIMAFLEKRRTVNVGNAGQTFLVGTTKIPALPFVLFGAHDVRLTKVGLECNNWVAIGGNYNVLEEVRRLKELLDGSMLRVFEGLSRMSRVRTGKGGVVVPVHPRYEDDTESLVGEREYAEDSLEERDHRLSKKELKELDQLAKDVVQILDEQEVDLGYLRGALQKIDSIYDYMKENKDKPYFAGSVGRI